MVKHIHIKTDEEEKEVFKGAADYDHLNLSTWLRQLAHKRVKEIKLEVKKEGE